MKKIQQERRKVAPAVFVDNIWFPCYTKSARKQPHLRERGKFMGKFVIREVPSGIKFDLKATNGQVIATSEVYEAKSSCVNGIESVRKNAPIAKFEDQTVEGYETVTNPKFELYKDKAGEFRFRLKARNGEIIATSEGYTTHAACENGIESVRKNAPEAEIVE